VVVQVVAVVLYLVAGNPPDFGDAKKFTGWINTNSALLMWDAFLTGIATLPLLVLFVGLRSIIRSAGETWEWAAALFYGAGTVTIAVLIVGSAAEETSAFVSGSGTEPTTVRAAWAATASPEPAMMSTEGVAAPTGPTGRGRSRRGGCRGR